MTTNTNTFRSTLARVWRHAGAGVAVLLVVLALFVGYRLGRPAKTLTPVTAAETAHAEPADDVWYTCSMHPSVRLRDPNAKCPICFMDLIPVTSGTGGSVDGNQLTISPGAAARARVETAKVERRFPTAEVRLYGKVTYDETSVARLTAYFPGRIDRLFVNYVGVPVAKGDHLAELYSPELLGAFEELRQARRASDQNRASTDLVREATRDTLAAAREKLRLFGLTDDQIASIENGSFTSDRLTIYAPIGGVVTHLAVREGDYVQTGAPIATVADLSRLWLDLEAYESQLPALRWGQPVTFTVESHPGETFEGRVSFIEPMVDERTRTAAVRVAVDNADGHLKPGMFASAVVRARMGEDGALGTGEFARHWVCPMHPSIVKPEPGSCDICGMDLVPAETIAGVAGSDAVSPLVVPRTSVLFTGTRSVVYVAIDAETPTYEAREVTLGPLAGDEYIVRDGLSEGESVVVEGAFRVDSAMQIAGKPSMMAPGARLSPSATTPGTLWQ
ncbi:MAG: efflux RND transporter periplasmic adaptor subunit [Phycisphaerales bacterium]